MRHPWLALLVLLCSAMPGCADIDEPDLDGDGIVDPEDKDMDGDGFNNTVEVGCNSDPAIYNSTPEDMDNDGYCDSIDTDIDGDGLPNDWEKDVGLNPLDESDGIECHGMAEYCLRSYDNFTFPETHNSFSTIEDGVWMAVNHYTALQAQWDAGIRSFMLDTHHLSKEETGPDDVRFCHGDPNSGLFYPCIYSEVDAFSWLSHLGSLMNNSSGDLVSLLLENYVPGEHLDYLFEMTGMNERAFVHVPGAPWPSIGEMILNGTDLVVYWDYQYDERFPWLHHAWTHSWDTPYGESEPSQMSCRVGRGDGEQEVWHLNNWLSSIYGTGDPVRSNDVNDYDTLLNRSLDCWEKVGDRPTFIAVDFWENGEIVNVTVTLNKMTNWSDEIPSHP